MAWTGYLRTVPFPTAGRYIDACDVRRKVKDKPTKWPRPAHLVPDIRLKVLLTRDVDAYTAVLELDRGHLIRRARHRTDHHICCRQTFLQVERAGMNGIPGEEPALGCAILCGGRAFGVLLDGVNVGAEDARSVVCEQGRERATDDFRAETENPERGRSGGFIRRRRVQNNNLTG